MDDINGVDQPLGLRENIGINFWKEFAWDKIPLASYDKNKVALQKDIYWNFPRLFKRMYPPKPTEYSSGGYTMGISAVLFF